VRACPTVAAIFVLYRREGRDGRAHVLIPGVALPGTLPRVFTHRRTPLCTLDPQSYTTDYIVTVTGAGQHGYRTKPKLVGVNHAA